MSAALPPSLDPVAALAWQRRAPARAPWLHVEVGGRMQERLQWIRLHPQAWADWEAVRGGLAVHEQVAARYPQASRILVEAVPARAREAARFVAQPWWKRGWQRVKPSAQAQVADVVADGSVQMVWCNMALHLWPDPQGLLAQWHRALAAEGFLMFSCLGPDTVRELRELYARLGWPPPASDYTDMHDWGDMLVQAGFAEPVMDMERITLTWPDAAALLAELRELGRGTHPLRHSALRGRGWRERLHTELGRALTDADGRLALTFEVIYGHAVKPAPRVRAGAQTAVTLSDMKAMLRR